ncbi:MULTISPECIES: DUF418 domain-containing protein [unclassified Corynebacterium]|uniref:DUF418 domain-containing protein n=1 Tax=unclassified Corynebacterium TaxID=2624378 RepID=UPI00265160F2|nr:MULTISPECIES: DUF418 domain-containing protein [unclassified Corynebacterium]MDN8593625.1 DUF418 domain-containing protein [Corynebacterium sp. P4_F2]WKK55749.1 DUF418 domain-containing protein [Corynebacterium sp. P4-C1]WKK63156.1 DUF418 domain-containing protein [Corynebacterium sp. P8-C1]
MPKRIVGIDVCRAVALIAMTTAHLTTTGANTLGITGQLLYGFPAALFAFLAGVSMMLMARTAGPVQFTVRGVLLIAVHCALLPFAGGITVVLLPIGICMIALGFTTRWDVRGKLALFAVLTAASGLIYQFGLEPWALFGPPYPLAMWGALIVAGMVAEETVLPSCATTAAAAVAGAVTATTVIVVRMNYVVPFAWMEANGHTGGLLDIAGCVGMALAVLGLCSPVTRSFVLQPLGSMSLTIYCLHILTAQVLSFAVSVTLFAVFAVVWAAFFRRGPMEALVRWCIDTVTAASVRPTGKEKRRRVAAEQTCQTHSRL